MPDCSTASNHKIQGLCRNTAEKSRAAAIQLATISGEQRAACLRVAADTIRKDEADILTANLQDLAAAPCAARRWRSQIRGATERTRPSRSIGAGR